MNESAELFGKMFSRPSEEQWVEIASKCGKLELSQIDRKIELLQSEYLVVKGWDEVAEKDVANELRFFIGIRNLVPRKF